MDSLSFLERSDRLKPQPIYVLPGDEPFLKRHVLNALKTQILGPEPDSFALSTYPGDKASFAAVRNDLTTLPFLSPRRMVVIDNADPFVTAERKKLEKYVAEPSPTGVLVLDVTSWTSTTTLAKLLDKGTITCKTPPVGRLAEWCRKWCKSQYGKEIDPRAAQLLVDLVGADMGMLDQELNKLSLYVGTAEQIENADVDRLVGNSREQSTWQIFDLIGAGKPAGALAHLDRLFAQGDDPIKLLGAFAYQLRKMAMTNRLVQQGVPVGEAMNQAGVPGFPAARQGIEQQMRHLGKRRLDRLYDWLIQTDLGIKGSSQLPARTQLERLVIWLARPVARRN